MYASQRDYQGLTSANPVNSGLVPGGMRAKSGKIFNNLNNYEYFISSNHNDLSFSTKSFTFATNVNRKTCEKITQALAASWD